MSKDNRIHLGSLEHCDVLALLLRIGNVVDGLFLLLVFLLVSIIRILGIFCGFFGLIFCLLVLCAVDGLGLKTLGKCQILSVDVLEEDVIVHLGAELVILEATELDEGSDIIPILLVIFLLGLAHSGKLLCNLLGDVLLNLGYEAVVLKRTSGYVERKVGAIDNAFKEHQEFRDNLFDVICDKYLIVI